MLYSAVTIANEFLKIAEEEGKTLTNMQLQKLVYLAHGYSLAAMGKPLFYNSIHAWQWGPVIPKLYKPLRKYGAGTVTELIPTDDEPIDPDSEEYELLRVIWKAYGSFSGPVLSSITHRPGSPWSQTWESKPYGFISNELIADYYSKRLDEAAADKI